MRPPTQQFHFIYLQTMRIRFFISYWSWFWFHSTGSKTEFKLHGNAYIAIPTNSKTYCQAANRYFFFSHFVLKSFCSYSLQNGNNCTNCTSSLRLLLLLFYQVLFVFIKCCTNVIGVCIFSLLLFLLLLSIFTHIIRVN